MGQGDHLSEEILPTLHDLALILFPVTFSSLYSLCVPSISKQVPFPQQPRPLTFHAIPSAGMAFLFSVFPT